MTHDDEPLSIYLHIPFCSVRCSYCAFNTYVNLEHLVPDYVDALCRELDFLARGNPHQQARTIYFGGGTPSLLTPQQFDQIFNQLALSFQLTNDAEISLESNPNDLSLGYLRDLRKIGFNRLSIGMQSANDAILKMFDRQHDLQTVSDAMRSARAADIDNVNLDVIFGSPYETSADWEETVVALLNFEPNHVSMYGLELKGGTSLRQQVDAGELPQPDDDDFADMYEYASEQLALHGYSQYEISNWCHPGYECRHNLQYWRNLGYVGLGAGAHGFAGGYRYSTIASPERYIESLREDAKPDARFPLTPAVAKSSRLDTAEELYETIMMGMRLTKEGINRICFERRFGTDIADMFASQVERLSALGLLVVTPERIHLSQAGRLLSNAVIREFVEMIRI